MPWGFLGPITWKTRNGTRITVFGWWLVLPALGVLTPVIRNALSAPEKPTTEDALPQRRTDIANDKQY